MDEGRWVGICGVLVLVMGVFERIVYMGFEHWLLGLKYTMEIVEYRKSKVKAFNGRMGMGLVYMQSWVWWEDLEEGGERNTSENEVDEEEPDEVLFDSEDEDDCDDLFSGVWDAEVVAKRRGRKFGRKKAD